MSALAGRVYELSHQSKLINSSFSFICLIPHGLFMFFPLNHKLISGCRPGSSSDLLMTACVHFLLTGPISGPNSTFVLVNTYMNWTEAQSYCREHHTDLASVRNEAENQKVKELIPSTGINWIGLYRDTWKWSDGSSSSFRYWRGLEPNDNMEHCAAIYFQDSGRWEDWNCDKKNAFICQNGKHQFKTFFELFYIIRLSV
uniref:C-type lectin domain-containing protein n=1 Tax=Kryptolebias marmoratus TaxID=37003 RepID=A0A3Q3AHD6_KRYMA